LTTSVRASLAGAMLLMLTSGSPGAGAQPAAPAGNRLSGLEWRFVRIRYHFTTENTPIEQDFAGEPW
jgi:hypothetical protein